jgi:thiol-disulfide isomerase/thioredoxin
MTSSRNAGPKRREKGRFPWQPVLFLVIVIALVAAGTWMYLGQTSGGGGSGDDGSDGPGDVSGPSAPAYTRISIQDVEGGSFNLSQYKGKVILLDMFATWCGPCESQLTELQKVRAAYPESEVAIITVDVDTRETASEVLQFRNDRGITWRFAMTNAQFSKSFPASSIPTMYYLDGDGRIKDKAVGAESSSEVMERIDRILGH